MFFKKISTLHYRILAYILYYLGVFLFNFSQSDQRDIDDIWSTSLYYDLKSGNAIWVIYLRFENGDILWKSVRDKTELIFALESNSKGIKYSH
jgi:hypothetical protein